MKSQYTRYRNVYCSRIRNCTSYARFEDERTGAFLSIFSFFIFETSAVRRRELWRPITQVIKLTLKGNMLHFIFSFYERLHIVIYRTYGYVSITQELV